MIKDVFVNIILKRRGWVIIWRLSYMTFFVGLCSIFFINKWGEQNFISENALTAELINSSNDILIKNEINRIQQTINNGNIVDFLEKYFESFEMKLNNQEFSFEENGKTHKGRNLYGIFHAKHTNNAECDIFSFSLDENNLDSTQIFKMAFVLSLIKFCSHPETNYLSRNVIFLAYDQKYKYYGKSVKEFLHQYLEPDLTKPNELFQRCGIIRHAINIDFETEDFNAIQFSFMGIDGRVPDLDFFALFDKLLLSLSITFTHKRESKFENKLQNIMQYTVEKYQKYLKLLSFPNIKFDFSHFFGCLNLGIRGEIHEPHPYFLKAGINAITLKGIHKKTINQGSIGFDHLSRFFKLIESGVRAISALDEQLHAGSTFYFPTNHAEFISISRYFIPPMIVSVSLIIQAMVLNYHLPKINDFHFHLLNHIETITFGFSLLSLPKLSEELMHFFNNNNNHKFCMNALENIELPMKGDTIKGQLYSLFILLTICIYIIVTTLFQKILMKFFGIDNKIKSIDGWKIQKVFAIAFISLSSIFWLFFNLGLSYFSLLMFSPFCLIVCPLKFRNRTQHLFLFLNLFLIFIYLGIISLIMNSFGLDIINQLIYDVLMDYQCLGNYFYIYLITTFIPSFLFIFKILIY